MKRSEAMRLDEAWHNAVLRLHDEPVVVVRRLARVFARSPRPRFKERLSVEIRTQIYGRIFEG